MFILVLLFLLLALGIMVLLWAGTLWIQGYIYSEPVGELFWRAPAAAVGVAIYIAFWCFLDYRSPGRYSELFRFSIRDDLEFKEFWSVKQGKETHFVQRKTVVGDRSRLEFFEAQNPTRPWTTSETIIVEEKGAKVRFEAERDQNNYFKRDPASRLLRYLDSQGRVMTDAQPGVVSVTRWSRLLVYFLLNGLHLVLWFAALWPVLRFQWSHALGLAVVLWLATTLLILPMLFEKVEGLAVQRGLAGRIAQCAASSSASGACFVRRA